MDIHTHVLLPCHYLRKINGESKGIVQFEGVLGGDDCALLFFSAGFLGGELEQFQSTIQCAAETPLFIFNDSGDMCGIFG